MLPVRMCLSGLGAVAWSHQTFPGSDGPMPRQCKSHDRARAHERRQTWKKWLSIMFGVEVTALLGAQLKLTFLLQMQEDRESTNYYNYQLPFVYMIELLQCDFHGWRIFS